jgi:lysophospholipase L1-like esterase
MASPQRSSPKAGRLPRKAAWVILTVALLAVVQAYVPFVKNYRFFNLDSFRDLARFTHPLPEGGPASTAPALQQTTAAGTPAAAQSVAATANPQHPLLDPGHALDAFFRSLLRTERREGAAVTTILHYGESPTSADLITADARRLLQARFGNAGHGFVLIAKPWGWYSHDGVVLKASGWRIDPASSAQLKDGFYGLGGVSFTGSPRSRSEIRILDRTHTHVEVSYLAQPGGGRFAVLSGGQLLGEVDTQSEEPRPGFAGFELPPQAGEVVIQGVEGPIRLFGLTLLKAAPGVVYHSLGLNGAYSEVLGRRFDLEHWREQIRHYHPDLIIINYGTNETGHGVFPEKWYEGVWERALDRARDAAGETPLLVMSPMDVGTRGESGEITTLQALEQLMAVQRRVALAQNLPVYNTFLAMGGAGTMARWYAATPRLVSADYIHPTPAGAKIVAGEFIQALLEDYDNFKRGPQPEPPGPGRGR